MLFQAKNIQWSLSTMHGGSEDTDINVIILQLVEIMLAATFACTISVLSTLSGHYNLESSRFMHYGTCSHSKNGCVSSKNLENLAFSVNIAQTEKIIASIDHSYHQHWLNIHLNGSCWRLCRSYTTICILCGILQHIAMCIISQFIIIYRITMNKGRNLSVYVTFGNATQIICTAFIKIYQEGFFFL